MAEERTDRRLAAILTADVVGYSRLMEQDELGTVAALKKLRADLIEPKIAAENGRIVKLMGDGMLVEFASVTDAVQCAVELQEQMAVWNLEVPQDRRIELRIGINLGDVILEGNDIYGDGVNVAARLEGLAEPCGLCISGTVHDAIGKNLASLFEFMGEQQVKNIEKPVRAYRLGMCGGAAVARKGGTGAPSARGKQRVPTLAVKPFENVGSNPEQAHWADGITYGILGALTRVHGLALIQDESASLAKSKQMSIQELTRRFDVRYILKGGVRKHDGRIRVNAELLEAATGRYIWAEQFDRDLRDTGDLFAIQDEIVEQIVTALDVKLLTGEAARLVRTSLSNPAALENVDRGELLLWSSPTRVEIREAQRLFEEVIRLEPNASVGYAEAGLAYWLEAISGLSASPIQSLEKAVEFSRQALALGDITGYPHLVLAHIQLSRREYGEAEAEASEAVLARPSCPAAYSLKAAVLNYLGRPDEAIEFAQYAVRLTPVQLPIFPAMLAGAYHGAGRHEEAVGAAKAALELDDKSVDPHLILAAANVALGHIEAARWAAEKVLKLKPRFHLAEYAVSQPYKEQKHLDRLLDQLRGAGLR